MRGELRPAAGKVSSSLFERVIKPSLGAGRHDVVVGPRSGVDVGVLNIGSGQVMVLTCDPLFVMPAYGWRRAAWFAVHIVASDAATSGLCPSLCAIDLNLPLDMTDDELALLWEGIHETCRDTGVAIVTGHTGRYEGCAYPMLGACTMMSIGSADGYVTPDMARVGDEVVITKGAAIETTGQLGVVFERRICDALGPDVAREAAALFFHMSVVKDASIAAEIGVRDAGVTGMHDATERGVWGGLVEIAEAAGVGLTIDGDAIPVRPEVAAVCGLFRIDPFTASSEGTLLITCRPSKAACLVQRLQDEGIQAARIGEVLPPECGLSVTLEGRATRLQSPETDPFWPAFTAALEESR
ncbi:MAG: AIR synthase family protein [Chloroflexota bacterium]